MITRNPITSHDRGVNAYAAYKQARQVKLSANPKKKKKKNYTDRAPDRRMSGSDSSYYRQNKSAPRSGGGTQKRNGNVSSGVRETQKKAYNETAGGRFTQGFIRNGMMAGMPSETKATYTDSHDKQRKVSESKAYKAGKIIGDFASYGTGYSLAGKAIARATGKAVAKKAAKELGEKVVKETAEKTAEKTVAKTAGKLAKAEDKVATKAGEKILKTNEKLGNKIAKSKAVKKYAEKKASKTSEVAKIAGTAKRKEAIAKDVGAKAADKITKSLIADATAGTVLDTARAKGEGIDIGLNKDYAKYMGSMAAANVVFGAGMEGLGAGAGKLARSQAAKKGAQTVRKLVNGKQKDVKIKNETHVPSTLKGRESAEKVGKIQKDFTEMPTVPKGQKMKDALSPEEIRQRRNVQNRYSEVTKESRARQEARGDYNRSLKKKGVQEERVRQVKDIAPEMPKSADDYVARINTARKYADDNNINFSDVVKEHNGNRAEAINDLVARAEKSKPVKTAERTVESGEVRGIKVNEKSRTEFPDFETFKQNNKELIDRYAKANEFAAEDVDDAARAIYNREKKNFKSKKIKEEKPVETAEIKQPQKQIEETPKKGAKKEKANPNKPLSESDIRKNAKTLTEEHEKKMAESGTTLSDYDKKKYRETIEARFRRNNLSQKMRSLEVDDVVRGAQDENSTVTNIINKDRDFWKWRDPETEAGAKHIDDTLAWLKEHGLDPDEDDYIFEEALARRFINDEEVMKLADEVSPRMTEEPKVKGEPDNPEQEIINEALSRYSKADEMRADIAKAKTAQEAQEAVNKHTLEAVKEDTKRLEEAEQLPKSVQKPVTDKKPVNVDKVPEKEIGKSSVRDVVNAEKAQAERISGYKELQREEQKRLTKAFEDEKFMNELKENDGKIVDSIIDGSRNRGIAEAKQTLNQYDEYILKREIRIAQETTKTEKAKPKIIQKICDFCMTTKEQFTDTAESIYQASKKMDDPLLYQFFDRFRQVRAYADAMIAGDKQVIITKDGGYEEIGKSLRNIFDPIVRKGDEYYIDLQKYLYNKHNIQRYTLDKPVYGESHTVKESNRVIAELREKYKDNFEEFDKYAKEIYDYNNALLKMEYESGLISKETYENLRDIYPNYVPTYRKGKSNTGVVKDLNEIGTKMFPSAKGSNEDFLPLHEQMMFRTRQVTESCALNDFGIRLLGDMKDKGLIGKLENIAEGDVEKEYLTDIAEDKIQKVLQEEGGKYIFNVKQNGKVVKVPIDKRMFDATKEVNSDFFKLAPVYKANKVFRSLVTTYNPTFAPTNGIRDFLDAPSFSKHGIGAFVTTYPKAWKMMAQNDELYQVYKALGGKGGDFFDIAMQFSSKNRQKLNPLWWVERGNEAIEQAPRFTEFLLTLEKGGNSKENVIAAFNNSKEVTVNFGRHGSAGQVINANGGTFFNAAMQDVVRITRAVGEGNFRPLIMGATFFGIAPAVINEMLCGDDEHYKALRATDKDTNFFIPIGEGRFVKIPKGRVVSAFSMPVQRGLRLSQGNMKGEDFFKGMGESLSNQIAPKNPIEENLLTPAAEAFFKKDGKTWYGADIVPSSLKKLPEAEQYDENTTRAARMLGEQLNVSPKKLDYVIKQYTGYAGTVLRSNSKLGTEAAEYNPFPSLPVMKTFTTKFVTDAVTNNELQSKIFEKSEAFEKLKNSAKATKKDNLNYQYYSDAAKVMSDYNKQVKEIQSNKNLTDEQKLKQVREIREEQNKVARDYLESEGKMKIASRDAVKQVDKSAFEGYESDSKYQSALKTQMGVNLRGAEAMLIEEDKKRKEKGDTLLSTELKEAGLTAKEYYDLQAKNISLSTYTKAKEKGVSLEHYSEFKKATDQYENGYSAQAMVLIKSKAIKNAEEAEIYDINEKSYNLGKYYLDKGYTPEQVYKKFGDIQETTKAIVAKYGNGKKRLSKEALQAYIDTRSDLSQAEKHNMWYQYCYNYPWFINANPY